uniref:Replication-associated protein n=1 Tax=Cressdnavirus D_HF4_1353 TaxID=3071198 RepID=A0AA50Q8R0_9VIRU|nr:replication-associated protein [Cressdnavirus D_HF4_1353]
MLQSHQNAPKKERNNTMEVLANDLLPHQEGWNGREETSGSGGSERLGGELHIEVSLWGEGEVPRNWERSSPSLRRSVEEENEARNERLIWGNLFASRSSAWYTGTEPYILFQGGSIAAYLERSEGLAAVSRETDRRGGDGCSVEEWYETGRYYLGEHGCAPLFRLLENSGWDLTEEEEASKPRRRDLLAGGTIREWEIEIRSRSFRRGNVQMGFYNGMARFIRWTNGSANGRLQERGYAMGRISETLGPISDWSEEKRDARPELRSESDLHNVDVIPGWDVFGGTDDGWLRSIIEEDYPDGEFSLE